ncbi:activating transcription factor 4b [Boleophthalmus pectinirostris]|uniref:activating transcription factor 4b n=1 Tax=Boleophthalmus pectinirostris TaxID=150288 RepID=UPI0024304CA0|nr:activating transcription factor 4b [Boleophthalmus pectinirostris]
MTTMMTSSQFGLEDMEALLWGPTFPMADPMDSFFVHPDQDEQRRENSFEGSASPASPLNSSLSSSSSPPPFYSPPPSPPTDRLHGNKPGSESDLLSISWLDHPGQLRSHAVSDDSKENAFGDLDWMDEREFDFDSLIGSCSPSEDSPSSPEDLLASLDCSMDFDPYPVTTFSSPVHTSLSSASLPEMVPSVHSTTPEDNSIVPIPQPASPVGSQEVPSTPPSVPEPQEELEIKSEPASPEPSSPYTLELGSEVDVSESEVEVTEVKPVVASVIPQIPRFVVSLSPTRIVLVLAPREELGISTTTVTTTTPSSEAPEPTPSTRASRSRPYPEPKYKVCPSPPTGASVKVKSSQSAMEDRVPLKAPRDKKLKKMEQNKTAATRYRQKKRAEQDALLEEHAILERKNLELTEKAESMAREIQYLKELMEEVRLTRIKKGLSADP